MAPAQKQALDRRAFTRVPHPARAVFSTGRGELEATVVDLSVGGVQLEVRGALEPGEFVRVRLPLSPGDETSWVDPGALVARSRTHGHGGACTVGLSFLGLSPAVLRRLSNRVAEGLSAKHAIAGARAAQRAEPGTTNRAPKKMPASAKSAPRDAQRITATTGSEPLNHSAPAPSANEPPGGPDKRSRSSGVAQILARLFGRRSPRESPANGRALPLHAPTEVAANQTSQAELRDLFRSAVASVKNEDAKSRKR